MLHIHPIPAFNDNYIWCLSDSGNGKALVVDPGQAEPVLARLEQEGLELDTILVTHHHPDHVGGIASLAKAWPRVRIVGPRTSPYRGCTEQVAAGEQVNWGALDFSVMEVPGHTLDHIAYFSATEVDGHPVLFCGDTLFVCGCGRLFEGTPGQMRASLEQLRTLPDTTAVYCAHEYTLANLRYARHLLPNDAELASFEAECKQRRSNHEPTVPAILGRERSLNPFLRWDDEDVIAAATDYARRQSLPEGDQDAIFAAIRHGKDHF
ncbi:MAG: hydroxyacylglutathione hydrolase [Marinobacter sp.]|uniref:hydroxyacylglutathione hydrolase n=1 Tax=Marinobacter sp. TaxID=50741 RepID=UPI00299E899C|nr:hydroxyacylglutathione hydrolase [Marinobacter sp.]MDX1754978.1 hydroxyacylglutathione hydrolase [Marinobacter sp.]